MPGRRRGAARPPAWLAEVPQHFPRPGWVEHDPEELWESVLDAAAQAGLDDVDTIAITNERETTLLWERSTGRPVAPAIVCRPAVPRSAAVSSTPTCCASAPDWSPIRTSPPRTRVAPPRVRRLRPCIRHGRHLARLEAHERCSARDRCDERVTHAARLAADARLGRRAAALFEWTGPAAANRSLRRSGGGGRAARRSRSDPRDRGRPASRALRTGLSRRGRREGHLWHRQFRARAHGRRCLAAPIWAPEDGRGRRLRARRSGARRRRSAAVAARRAASSATWPTAKHSPEASSRRTGWSSYRR